MEIKVFVVAVTHKPNGSIRPIDYQHGEFKADKDEPLLEFLRRIGMPTEKARRITLPEWYKTYTNLSGRIGEYDIRDGDVVYILYKW